MIALLLVALVVITALVAALILTMIPVIVAVLIVQPGADGLGMFVVTLGGGVVTVRGCAGISRVQTVEAAALVLVGMAVLVGAPVIAALVAVLAVLVLTVLVLTVLILAPVALIVSLVVALSECGGGCPCQQYAQAAESECMRKCHLHWFYSPLHGL